MKRLVIGRGSVFADLLIIGEAPGAQEDLEGKPYVGKSGKLLNELLTKAGIDYVKDVYFCNVIKCRPPNNRKPTTREINTHKPWLLQQIKLVDPKFILLTGSTAMRAILEVKDPISNLRGQWIKKDGREIMVIFHPSYLLRFSSKEINKPYHLTLKDLENVSGKLYAV
ncbi:phage SPO1 DNA polymerasee-related protein [Prochlorococcus marinus str. MIT 9321]|uniref:Type-4 uracil-DNA glycosylase n=1 Tax=Prochlorococcus marinus str. MIT 9401 TaxID=167551 RepID=A0A0A2B095_PROMR|nr:uracil-DNA glycosylase [Prochlorococcus marinus]KGG03462.1 phage SPO1 DNA polymerasee-related protein [Prochlorococcus marinus str. MIT 9321]KGG04604.1 phage SPO1 DNA polymerasee-related protein [Prochlorococcus marinus str. MIT 9322]KGG07286.1 phage SPO1 DNA polymerasee-related protein [Prochlorococcus marinus str. MIT 9401]